MSDSMIIAIFIIYSIVLLIFCILLLLTIRQVGLLNLRVAPKGSRMMDAGPDIASAQGDHEIIKHLVEAHCTGGTPNLLIVFVSPSCSTCRVLYPALKVIAKESRENLLVIAAVSGMDVTEEKYLRKQLGEHIAIENNDGLFNNWGISGTPYCVVLDKNLVVASKGITNNIEHLDSLLNAIDEGVASMEDYMIKHNSVRNYDRANGN